MLFLSAFKQSKAQELYLIEETDSIQIFETYLSNTSKGNLFPTFYKNGLLYVSNFQTKEHELYFSDLQNLRKKLNWVLSLILGLLPFLKTSFILQEFQKD